MTVKTLAVPLPARTAEDPTPWRGGWRSGLPYGALGLPLAFVALPLYVLLPAHYAREFGVPLATLGALLLGVRLFDAVIDPWIGRITDTWFARSTTRVLAALSLAGVLLALGFHALFFPAARSGPALLWWFAGALVLTTLTYSVMSVAHQAWGARLGGGEDQRARIVAWREGLALVGVLVASVLPSLAGLRVTSAAFAALVLGAVALLWSAPRPQRSALLNTGASAAQPWRERGFRTLMMIFLVNGIASAVPATLVLFFVRDRLQAPNWEPVFLAGYFAAAALSMPLWMRGVARFGLARAWLGGMLLAVAAFAWAALLGAGDVVPFLAVCLASGIALGADLALPGAMLAGVIQRAGHGGRLEGIYFGWWNFATKLNLALAAGLALPMLGLFGYTPGSQSAQGLLALTLTYCLLPCVLKLAAAAMLHMLWIRKEP
jgi:Na+/melibiose symporter-like transporter